MIKRQALENDEEMKKASAGESIPAEMVAVAENRLSTFDRVKSDVKWRL